MPGQSVVLLEGVPPLPAPPPPEAVVFDCCAEDVDPPPVCADCDGGKLLAEAGELSV
jgi:hypothetical protein